RNQLRLGNARRQIARVDAAEAARAQQSDAEPSSHLTLSLVTSSSRTLISGGTGSPRITFTALSTAARPISDGNCATDASIAPAAIAFLASSTPSNPTTPIPPLL